MKQNRIPRSTYDDGTPSVYWCPDCLFPMKLVGYMKDWAAFFPARGASQYECPNGHRHVVTY